ncbi:MAG: glutaredoxin domain-containing protein [Planctomycetaceae bacterium]
MIRLTLGCLGIAFIFLGVTAGALAAPPDPPKPPVHVVVLEAFVRSDLPSAKTTATYLDDLQRRVPGLQVRIHDVLKDRQQLARLYELSEKSGRDKPVIPAFHCCSRMYFGFASAKQSGPRIEELFTCDVYTRTTCPKCSAAKRFIKDLQTRWPAIRFRILDVGGDLQARAKWEALCRTTGGVPGLPTFDFAGRVIIGYQGDDTTGRQWEQVIRNAASAGRPDPAAQGRYSGAAVDFLTAWSSSRVALGISTSLSAAMLVSADRVAQDSGSDELELPEEAGTADIGVSAPVDVPPASEPGDGESIDVPIFGKLRVSELGMPVFTLLVGLVDGFNPCAMWILVFLLSVLVNIKDRRRILAIAGTFVVISGLAYFAFMAAWLNLFVLIGIVRPVQIALGALALLIGIVNVKDFFAFKKGISFSIPESQKPGIYRRVRRIVDAKYMSVALAGAIGLAVVVNIVELLCTAGLPALYTQILMLQGFPTWQNYGYLALYNAAYMFDDALLVTIVVVTLSHRKLQEREGRWLKLISGLVILVLGVVMIFRPSWLQLADG